MTDHDDTTPIPTDVLRAWVDRVDEHGGPFESATIDLRRAAVAALPGPRRPVTRETPHRKRIVDEHSGEECTFIAWDGDRIVLRDRMSIYYSDTPDGWYEVDEPEPEGAINYDGPDSSVECALPGCTNRLRKSDAAVPQCCSREHRAAYTDPLPGTRVGERMTEHTPVGATVKFAHEGVTLKRVIIDHPRRGADFDSGGWGQYGVWTVVALPEESERKPSALRTDCCTPEDGGCDDPDCARAFQAYGPEESEREAAR